MQAFEYTEELLNTLVEEEKKYQFDTFSHADARKLGEALYEESRRYNRPVAVEIRINGDIVYKYLPDGCQKENSKWLRAKSNTVDSTGMSSLHLAAVLCLEHKSLEDKRMNAAEYAACGGGFPLIVKGIGMIGTICVSGLPHYMDHALIVQTLEKWMGE